MTRGVSSDTVTLNIKQITLSVERLNTLLDTMKPSWKTWLVGAIAAAVVTFTGLYLGMSYAMSHGRHVPDWYLYASKACLWPGLLLVKLGLIGGASISPALAITFLGWTPIFTAVAYSISVYRHRER
jgi:hypothetical protein